jgi:hypothetical protein
MLAIVLSNFIEIFCVAYRDGYGVFMMVEVVEHANTKKLNMKI